MGTSFKDDKWFSNGGRVLFVVGQGKTLSEAREDAYKGVDAIDAPGLFHRNDIGWQAVKK